ncbi:MAG: aminopeptidase [Gemmatimonadota bacterium]
MKRRRAGLAPVLWLAVLLAAVSVGYEALDIGAAAPERDGSPANPADLEAIARKVVVESAAVKEGEVVLISGNPRDLELVENIAVNVRKLGAHPIVTVNTDRMLRRMYDDVPAEFDAQEPKADLALTQMTDVFIALDSNEDPAVLSGVPPERIAARGRAGAPVTELAMKKGVRTVSVGNGLYPTVANAKILGLPVEALAELFWSGVGADYDDLQARGKTLEQALKAGREVHLTNPNGTDLRFRIENRPVFVSDGVISAEDVARGGSATTVWLPAGEVFTTPVPGTAEGKLVVDRDNYQGQEIRDVTLTFERGKVTSLSAASGLEPFQAFYDASGAGKEEFAYFDIGMNQAIRPPAGGRLDAFMPAGMVTVGIGNNLWAGGENDVPLGTAYFMPGSTVEMDGKVLVQRGELKM